MIPCLFTFVSINTHASCMDACHRPISVQLEYSDMCIPKVNANSNYIIIDKVKHTKLSCFSYI